MSRSYTHYVSMQPLGEVLCEMSWNWIQDNEPELAQALREVVESGARAEDVRSYVMRITERRELALRCEQAAKHLIAVAEAKKATSQG